MKTYPCAICGTEYLYEDLAKVCAENTLQDKLDARIGDKVICTQYVGDEWTSGIVRIYSWTYVRDKRIVPFSRIVYNSKNEHIAEYKIGDIDNDMVKVYPEYADRWEEAASGSRAGCPLGPYHFWSKSCVEKDWHEKWPDYVIGICRGEKTNELMEKLAEEGYK